MLSRTADSLFWMGRYVERAENMARLMDMGRRMGGVPGGSSAHRNEWPSILSAAGCAAGFAERGEAPSASACMRYLTLDAENLSSVVSCFELARANARSARGALTREMWEAINDSWIELRRLDASKLDNGSISPLLDWIKGRGAFFRGSADSSALRNDGYEFLRLGAVIERMDNTARLLDVKYVDPAKRAHNSPADGAVDHNDWVAILRAGGVLRAFHAAYRADYEPRLIADFLIKNPHCPRSLTYCAERIDEALGHLARFYQRRERCHDEAAELHALLDSTDVDAVFYGDAHGFLSSVIRRNNLLALSVAEAYHFAPRASEPEAPAEPAPAPAVASSSFSAGMARQSQGQGQGQTQSQSVGAP